MCHLGRWLAVAAIFCLPVTSLAEDSLQDELRALDSLRTGLDTPLDEVDRLGKELLARHREDKDRAQIYFQLAHVHVQSGMKHPDKIIAYAQEALATKLLRPDQRSTLYSYLSSAHEVDPEIKDFAARRKIAVQPLLQGLSELQSFGLPEKAPEPPIQPVRDFIDRESAEAARREREAFLRLRQEAERTRELVFRRNVLRDQVKFLYSREADALDELRAMATKAIDEESATALVAVVKAERERRAEKPKSP